MGYVMTRISEATWQKLLPTFNIAAQDGRLNKTFLDPNSKPTHIIDIYKMRRGRFKNVRIWINLHLGTGYRKDLFMTDANNCPLSTLDKLDIYSTFTEIPISWEEVKGD